MSEQTADRAAFERAVNTARAFLDRLEQHVDPETAQVATWTAVLERAERFVGREQLAGWLRDLASRLGAETGAELRH